MKSGLVFLVCAFVLGTTGRAREKPTQIRIPQIDGPWWQVAGNPMNHKYATERQEPVDFAIWQAADGTWQLWSCIRNTTAGGKGGKTRFFYRWQGRDLTGANWQPMGIAMEADPSLGETPGGLQAPHVVNIDGIYHMFYGDWVNICHATSKDGKDFTRIVQSNGPALRSSASLRRTSKTGMFSEGPGNNTRDVMLMQHKGMWYVYYTAFPNRQGMVYVRTTKDFENWSQSIVVSFAGRAGTGPSSSECPHVVKLGPKEFYLFKTQTYGPIKEGDIRNRGEPQTSIYRSSNPTMFGINQDDRYFICTLPVAAPEIICYQGQFYVAALNAGALDGIRIARLQWVRK